MKKILGVLTGVVLLVQGGSVALASSKYTAEAERYVKGYLVSDDVTVEDGLDKDVEKAVEKGESLKSLTEKLTAASKLSNACQTELYYIRDNYRAPKVKQAEALPDSNWSKKDLMKADYGLDLDESVGNKAGFDPNAMGASAGSVYAAKLARIKGCNQVKDGAARAYAQCGSFAKALESTFPAALKPYSKTCSVLISTGSTKSENEKASKSGFVATFMGPITQGTQDQCSGDSDILERVRIAEKTRIMCSKAHSLLLNKIGAAIKRGTLEGAFGKRGPESLSSDGPTTANKPKDVKKEVPYNVTSGEGKSEGQTRDTAGTAKTK